MSRRRLPWQLVVGGLLTLGGAAILLFVLVDRVEEPKPKPKPKSVQVTPRGFGEVAVRVKDSAGKTRRWCLLAARDKRQRERGLMQVRDKTLGGHDGMVFLFDTDQRGSFWMRNTPMPLSIAYIDRTGKVVSITDMAPCGDSPGCPSYPAGGPFRTAIEVPRGGLVRLGVGRASRVEIAGRCSAATQD